jgi:hypothetical protein
MIGSGVPNRQLVSVQSTPTGVVPDSVALTVQAGPTQESPNRLVAPAGVTLSGTCEAPPPSDRFAQTRFLSGVVPPMPRNVLPHVPPPAVVRKSNFVGPEPSVDVVVLDVDVVVELELDVLELVDDEVLVLDDVEVLVLEEVELDVDDVLVLLVDDVLVLVLDVDDVLVDVLEDVLDDVVTEVLVDVEDEVLVLVLDVDDVDVEVELVEDVLVDVELVVLVVVVVVVAFGLHWAGSGLTNSGTATASIQSVLKVDTQSTQSTMSPASRIAPVQLDGGGPNVVTAGQVLEKPIGPAARSPLPSQSLSAPPHALQMLATFFASAFEMRRPVLPAGSPGTGHEFEWSPFRRRSQHFWSAFDRATMNFDVDLPIAC